MTNKLIVALGLCTVLVAAEDVSGCSNAQVQERYNKTAESEKYGLNRTVTVYGDDGKEIKQYKGKIDIEDNDAGNKVLFDIPTGDGDDTNRIIIYGGTVIVEEE